MFVAVLVITAKSGNNPNVHWWMDKQTGVYPYNGALWGNQKEWSADTHFIMSETWEHYIKWKESVTKDQSFMIMCTWNIQKRQIHRNRKISECLGMGIMMKLRVNG